jgi:hypothetical protein
MFRFTTETSAPAIISFRTTVHRNTLNWIRVQRVCAAGVYWRVFAAVLSSADTDRIFVWGSGYGTTGTGGERWIHAALAVRQLRRRTVDKHDRT